MTIEQLERGKVLQGIIDSCKRNLKNYERLKKAEEIRVETNITHNEHCNIYLSTERKDMIVTALRNSEEEKLSKALKEFQEL